MTMEQSQFQEVSFQANYYFGSFMSGAQGGKLHIYDDVAIFKPHLLNIGTEEDYTITIRDICGYKKGMLTWLTIYLNNGTEVKLAVWKKDEIIQALELRRYAIYRKIGQEIPQLTKF